MTYEEYCNRREERKTAPDKTAMQTAEEDWAHAKLAKYCGSTPAARARKWRKTYEQMLAAQ